VNTAGQVAAEPNLENFSCINPMLDSLEPYLSFPCLNGRHAISLVTNRNQLVERGENFFNPLTNCSAPRSLVSLS
jgi:hypothetical protein